MKNLNKWEHSLTAFNEEFVYPENHLEWKTISYWKTFWNNSWIKKEDKITKGKLFNISNKYLNKIKYKEKKLKYTKMEFKQLCIDEITNKSFPTFLSLIVLSSEFDLLTEVSSYKKEEIERYNSDIFKVFNLFLIESPQIHQIVIFLIMKISKILNSCYFPEEMEYDKKNLKKLNTYIDRSIKMAMNDLSIHKYNMKVKDNRIIIFEYDILIQFLNMLINAYVRVIINYESPIKEVVNEISIFEEKVEIINKNLDKIKEEWLREEAKKSLSLFIKITNGLKHYKVKEKIIVKKEKPKKKI